MPNPLMQPQGPFFHRTSTWEDVPEAAVCVVEGARCGTTLRLFEAFAEACGFPGDFSATWDGLDEGLTDLEWLPSRHVILRIRDAGAVLPEQDDALEILIEILATTAEAWAEAADEACPMSFHVVLEDTPERLKLWEEALDAQVVAFR